MNKDFIISVFYLTAKLLAAGQTDIVLKLNSIVAVPYDQDDNFIGRCLWMIGSTEEFKHNQFVNELYNEWNEKLLSLYNSMVETSIRNQDVNEICPWDL